jgi:hypothetical protein
MGEKRMSTPIDHDDRASVQAQPVAQGASIGARLSTGHRADAYAVIPLADLEGIARPAPRSLRCQYRQGTVAWALEFMYPPDEAGEAAVQAMFEQLRAVIMGEG